MQPYSLLVEVQENVHTCAKLRQSRPTLCNAMDDGHQAPLFMGFSTQEYWSGLPCPSPGELPNPGIEPTSLTSPALAGGFFTTSATWEAPNFPSLSHEHLLESYSKEIVNEHKRPLGLRIFAILI